MVVVTYRDTYEEFFKALKQRRFYFSDKTTVLSSRPCLPFPGKSNSSSGTSTPGFLWKLPCPHKTPALVFVGWTTPEGHGTQTGPTRVLP